MSLYFSGLKSKRKTFVIQNQSVLNPKRKYTMDSGSNSCRKQFKDYLNFLSSKEFSASGFKYEENETKVSEARNKLFISLPKIQVKK